MRNRRRLPVLLLCLLAPVMAGFAENRFSQRLEWTSDENALLFKVEVQDSGGSPVITTETEATFLEVSLAPGQYRYRVTAYDFLGREASTSPWTDFTVLKASQPEILSVQKEVDAPKRGSPLVIAVDIAGVSEGSTVELVSENIPGSLGPQEAAGEPAAGSETGQVSSVTFEDVPAGKWRIRVTNPSGYSAESDVIVVKGGKEQPAKDSPAEPVSAIAEPVSAIAEPAPAPEEPVAEEPPQEPGAEDAVTEAAQDPELAEDAAPAAEPKKPKEKKQKPVRPPYISKDIHIMPMLGLFLSPYDGALADYGGGGVAPEFGGRVSFFPKKSGKHQFGAEVSGFYARLQDDTTYYDAEITMAAFEADFMYRLALPFRNWYVAAKGGAGLAFVGSHIAYVTAANQNAAGTGVLRSDPDDQGFVYPLVGLGAAVQWVPFTFVVVQAGVDFRHVFIPDMPTGIFSPYVAVGLRL